MSNDEQFKFVPFGIFGSIIVGIGMLIAGAVNGIGALTVIGVIVLVGGIAITIACTVVLAIRKYSLEMPFRTEKKPSDAELIERITNGAHEYVSDLVSREDALTDLLYKHGRADLAEDYYEEAQPSWDKHDAAHGDNTDVWDEHLDKINALIDKYYERYKIEGDEIPQDDEEDDEFDESDYDKSDNNKSVDGLLSREDALTDMLRKSGRKDLEESYYAESEPIWDNYRGADWDENLDAIDSLIDKYYALFNGENVENSQNADDKVQKTAVFEEKRDRSPDVAQADREKSERDREPIKTEKINDLEEEIKTENIAVAVENANATTQEENKPAPTEELVRAVDRSPKNASIGYRPMKKK